MGIRNWYTAARVRKYVLEKDDTGSQGPQRTVVLEEEGEEEEEEEKKKSFK